MRKKALAALIALFISALFFYFTAVDAPSDFNIIPGTINEDMDRNGSSENFFVIAFDLVIALIMFLVLYKMKHLFKIDTIKKRVLAVLITLFIPALFFYFTVVSIPNAFNGIPVGIYETMDQNGTYENFFVVVFDLVVALIMFYVFYRMIKYFLEKA